MRTQLIHERARVIGLSVALVFTQACGDDGSTSVTAGSTTNASGDATTGTGDATTGTGDPTTTTTTTGATSTGETSASTTSATSTGEATASESTTTGVVSDTDATSTTGDTTTTTGDTTTGGEGCVIEEVPDQVEFTYAKTVDIGINNIQASYYNIAAGELVFFSHTGPGKRVALDGTVLGDVQAPPAVTNILDGATYDQVNQTALLLDQQCNFAEVDPVTIEVMSIGKVDAAKFGINICGGLAIGLDGNLYIASTLTDEIVVITRDLQDLVRRFKVDDDGLTNIDGVSLIAGSENFLLLSTYDLQAAIVDPLGNVVVPTSTIGQAAPPLIGGDKPSIPDASLTVCVNGNVWVCEGLQKVGCYIYVPEVESDSCPCVLPQ